MTEADWSEFDKYLLEMIGERLHLYIDYVRFCAVCHWWKSCVPKQPTHLPHELPCLMLPPSRKYGRNSCRGFFNIFLQNVYQLELPPEALGQDKLFRGSSHGWLAIVENGPSVYLINPLTRAQIQLPPITTLPEVLEYHPNRVGKEFRICSRNAPSPCNPFPSEALKRFFIQKIILSSSPSNKNCIAFAIYGDQSYLAFCKPGEDQVWTSIPGKSSIGFQDVILYKDRVYVVTWVPEVFEVVDLDSDAPRLVKVANKPEENVNTSRKYLVESSGDLLLVARDVDFSRATYKTDNFRVYQLNFNSTFSSATYSEELKTLGDQVLFLGYNESVSFSSRNLPDCRGDCIHYTDDYFEAQWEGKLGGADIGVFNCIGKTVQELPGYKHHSKLLWPPPIWVFPGV